MVSLKSTENEQDELVEPKEGDTTLSNRWKSARQLDESRSL
jgi:hypothetical protein